MMKKDKKILYIAGYGRSGSTLLERILSSHEKLFGTGELWRLHGMLDRCDWTCSCGKKVDKCEFWGEIFANLASLDITSGEWQKTQEKKESLIHFLNHVPGSSSIGNGMSYGELTKSLFEEIFRQVPESVSYLIDSSKTSRKSFFRPITLSRYGEMDVRVIHLIRDGRGCMWSNLKGSNRKIERGEDPNLPFAGLRTAISWPLTNSVADLFKRLEGSRNYLRLTYENFVNRPGESLELIGKFVEVDFTRQIDMLEKEKPIPPTHQLAGNRLRKKESIVLREDKEWKDKLTTWHNFLFWLLDWPWALKYGYRPFRSS